VARPLGGIVFGHFGDRVGRKKMLVLSMLIMGAGTTLIGLLPTTAQIGIIAPIALVLLRILQGIAVGGEWGGAALMALEHAPQKKRGFATAFANAGGPAGAIMATLVVSFFSAVTGDAFLTWGWRVPFLASAVIVALGVYVRVKLEETPVFARAVARGEKVKTPLKEVFRTSWRQLIQGTFIMLATYTLFYLFTTWILSYSIGAVEDGFLGIGYQDFLVLQLVAILFFAAFVPVSGALADRFGRKPFLIVVTSLILIFGLTFNAFLSPDVMGTGEGANMGLMLVFLIIGMILMGLTFGVQSAILPELFPTNVRYTGSAIAYNFSSILGAAVAPFIAAWLASTYGVGWVGVYLGAMALLTLLALFSTRETRDLDLDNVEDAVVSA
jgi:MFS family permease